MVFEKVSLRKLNSLFRKWRDVSFSEAVLEDGCKRGIAGKRRKVLTGVIHSAVRHRPPKGLDDALHAVGNTLGQLE